MITQNAPNQPLELICILPTEGRRKTACVCVRVATTVRSEVYFVINCRGD